MRVTTPQKWLMRCSFGLAIICQIQASKASQLNDGYFPGSVFPNQKMPGKVAANVLGSDLKPNMTKPKLTKNHGGENNQPKEEREGQVGQPDEDVLVVVDGWVREAHPGAQVNAGYMTLVNVNPEPVSLISAESKSFKSIEFHEMAMVDGMMEMRELAGVVIPANGRYVFRPGGKHLMLKKPFKRVVEGDQVEVKLTFSDGAIQILNLNVKKDL